MADQGVGTLTRLKRAVGYSFRGLIAAWQNEQAFRQEVLLAVVLIPASFWLAQDTVERALLIGSILLILIVELMNSAIEAVVDRIGPEHHLLSGRAKDVGSAAVFLAIVLAACIWLLVLLG